MDRQEFLEARSRDEFLEWAEFNDQLYGTPSRNVFETLAASRHVLLEIEVKGALQVRERAPTGFFVFVDVLHFPLLEKRLRARGTESEAAIHRRLTRARWGAITLTATTSASSTTTSARPPTTWSHTWSNRVVEVNDPMLEELKEEMIVNKVGGPLGLSTLIQKQK